MNQSTYKSGRTEQNTIYKSHISQSIPKLISPLIEDLSCNSITVRAICQGSLHIATIPSGANIYIYEESQGDYVLQSVQTGTMTSPTIIDNIECTGPTRSNKFKLTLPDYVDVEGILDIKNGEIYQLYIIMEKCTIPVVTEGGGLFIPALALGSLFFLLFGEEKEKRRKVVDYDKYKEIYE